QRAAPWRAATAAALAMALGLALFAVRLPLLQERDAAPRLVLLAPQAALAGGQNARFVASLSADGTALVLRPLQALDLGGQRTLELWALPVHGAPRSLGLLALQGTTTVRRPALLRDAQAIAVSVEPAGGSPTGAPTGPVVSLGRLAG
ncbi:MAG: anti-sigma factor, partial [Burkholderiales bacterium]|nr:anti-sigma factor [Burkholderiales bacterium]